MGIPVAFATYLAELQSQLLAAQDGSTIHVVDSILVPLVAYRTVEVASGTLGTVLASGRIGLIRNPELQQALAGWPAEFAKTNEDEVLLRDFVVERLIPGLAPHADLTGIMAVRTQRGLSTGEAFLLTGRTYPVQASRMARTLVGQRLLLTNALVNSSNNRLLALRRLNDLIAAELPD